MDTSRIVINTIDNSTSLTEETKEVTGFIVVKAPKGPRTPVKIASGSAAKIKDMFGVSSANYPELFELETFNKEYDSWVSAPYETANVPAAYITGDGVFPYSGTIEYNDDLEKIILGQAEPYEIAIDHFNNLSETENVLVDTRYPFSYHIVPAPTVSTGPKEVKDDIASSNPYPGISFADGIEGSARQYTGLLINTGMTKAQYDASKLTKFRINGLKSSFVKDFLIKADSSATGEYYIWSGSDNSVEVGTIGYISGDSFIQYTSSVSGHEDDPIYLRVVGSTATEDKGAVTNSYIKNNLDSDSERSALNTYWIKSYSANSIKGVIIPKYPSTRALHINFNVFNANSGYSVKSVSARNIIKMNVYEDDAFHDSSHKISISGSLNSKAVDGNGACIGFNGNNSSYSEQELIYVHSIKPFDNASELYTGISYEDEGETKFKYLQGYPSIILQDGIREFTETDYVKTTDTTPKSNKKYYKEIKDFAVFEGSSFVGGVKYYEFDDGVHFVTEDASPLSEKTYYELTETSYELYEKSYFEALVNTAEHDYCYMETEVDLVALHNYGWEYAANNDYSDVDVFFNSAIYDSLEELNKSVFFSLYGSDKSSNKLAGYIFNYTPATVDDNLTQLVFGRNYWNICNIAVTDLDNGDRILSPMTGAKALMQCRIIENRWGGIAPMWENSGTPSMGGQLKMITPYRLKYKYNKADMDKLDDCNYNPVINDRQYGIMVVGQKTCKDGEITDWSYIGHACAFLNFLKLVRENVMIPQIGKANNPYYRTLRKEQVEQYLNERLTGNNRIWAEGSVDTSTADGVNDTYALKARKFVINVRVKVDIFSETVELNFTNEDQSTVINAAE